MEKELEKIQKIIYEIRGFKVMLDSDLARLYEIETKTLNRAVLRNKDRFPDFFMFQLTDEEFYSLRCQIGTSKKGKGGRRYLPFAFTEHGVLMLSSVLNSKKAISVNIEIMVIFNKLRQYALSQSGAHTQITELRKLLMLHIENSDFKFSEHDNEIKQIIQVLNNFIQQPKPTRRIGFRT